MKQPELNKDVLFRLIGESHCPLSHEISRSPTYWRSRVQNVTYNKFIHAIKRNNISYVRYSLLENLINPITKDNEAIRWASRNGHTEIVRLLLEDERVDHSAVIFAAKNSN